MGLNKRLIGGAAAGGVVPTNTDNFDIVTYTGTGSTYNVGDGVVASVTINSGTANYARGSVSYSTGKRYFEVEYISAGGGANTLMVGIINTAYQESWTNAQTKMYYAGNGNKYTGGSGTSYGATYAPGDIIGVAYDGTNRTITFYKNNVSQGTAFTGLITNFPSYFPAIGTGLYSETAQFKFTSSEFTYTPPSGYSEWGSATVSAHSGTVNSAVAGQPIDFKPDLVWFKNRTGTNSHALVDSVRGRDKYIFSDLTLAEPASSAAGQDLVSFDSNGFTVGTVNNAGSTNVSGGSIVAWCWKGGGSSVSNTDGTITSTVSANQAAGFSIVKYTGNSTDNATVGHGLSTIPDLIIVKNLDSALDWGIWHSSLSTGQVLRFTTQEAQSPGTAYFKDGLNNSTVFGLGTNDETNFNNDNYIAYCFHSVDGYQKIGGYSGNSSVQAITTGFQPRFLIIKCITTSTGNWFIYDSARDTSDPRENQLEADTSSAETNHGAIYSVDFQTNGFELNGAGGEVNFTGRDYIYLAIA